MILEGVVTTLDASDVVNIAPMGPRLTPPYCLDPKARFELRPFRTARTCANLRAHPEGVLHITDDVLLLARAAVGAVEPLPELVSATVVHGMVLTGACRACEFRVQAVDDTTERLTLQCEVLHVHRLRDFFGFNRAMHAVIEAAILATRTDFLSLDEIEAEYRRLRVLVDKTGGPREREAFAFLERHIATVKARQSS